MRISACFEPGRWFENTPGKQPEKLPVVGVWHGGGKGEPELLASAYRRCFEVAQQHGLKSIAFPAISAGVYGYPMREAAVVALSAAQAAIGMYPELERVIFVQFNAGAQQVYQEAAARLGIAYKA